MSDLRFSAFYFFYFAAVGIQVPYWSVYLKSIGVDAFGIGLFVALVTSVKIVAPPLWAWACDRSPHPLRIVRISGVGATVCFALVFASSQFHWLVLAMFGFNLFWAAQLPQIDAVALATLGDRRHRYGRLRLWGSVGFIAAVLVGGRVVDAYGVSVILPILLGLYVATLLMTAGVDESAGVSGVSTGSTLRWRPSRTTILFLAIGLLMQASHGTFYTFFTIHLSNLGYSNSAAGFFWALGVLCEVGMFYFMHRVFAKMTVQWVLTASFAIACLRWLLLAVASDYVAVLIFTQMLHAVTFAAWHAASMQFIHEHFPKHMKHRGQALHGSLCFALGTAVGGLIAGFVWEHYGAAMAWSSAAAMAALATVLSLQLSVRCAARPH